MTKPIIAIAKKPGEAAEREVTTDDKQEAERNKEAARLWISGLETVSRKLGITRVIDLSATPFFLAAPVMPKVPCSPGP